MAVLTRQITEIVEQLPETDLTLVLEIVKRFLPDDVATADDLKTISIAQEEYRCGETVSHEDIDWD